MKKDDLNFIKGIIVPMITPIKDDETIDEDGLRAHIDFMIDRGISGILAFGSNGEFYMQTPDEMEEELKIIMDQVNNRIPVFMGIGAIRTKHCIQLAKLGERYGCKGVAILQPMFIKPSYDELISHFIAIAESVPNLPVLLYNNPGKTGYPIPQNMVYELAHKIPNIVGMKDSSGNMTETLEFIRRNRDCDFKVFCGKDTLVYSGLCGGCVGAVCSTANYVPELVCSIYNKFIEGNWEESKEAQFTLDPIRLQNDYSSFPVATKDCCNLIGGHGGKPYLPSKPSTPEQLEGLRLRLLEAGYIK